MKKIIAFILGILLPISTVGFAQDKIIKIGIIFPLTGQIAVYGEHGKKAAELALEEINSTGGINGNRVEYIVEDSAGTPKGGVAAAQKLIEIDKVDAIIGALFSNVALAIKPIIHSKKIVYVAPMATVPELFVNNKYFFSLGPRSTDEIYVNVKYCREVLSKNTLGTLYMQNAVGVHEDKTISKWWNQFKGQALIHESYTPGSTDFRTQLAKIKAKNPDILYLNSTPKEGAKIAIQIAELGLKTHVTSNSQLRQPDFLNLVPAEAIEGWTFTNVYTDKNSKEYLNYVKEFETKYNQEPNVVSLSTYDACNTIFEGMKKGSPSGDKLRDAISKLDMVGVFGPIKFREDGSSIRSSDMWIVKDGKFVSLNYIDQSP